jgi:hypothetical protein
VGNITGKPKGQTIESTLNSLNITISSGYLIQTPNKTTFKELRKNPLLYFTNPRSIPLSALLHRKTMEEVQE